MLARVGLHTGHAEYAAVNRIPLGRQPIEIRRLIKRAAKAAEIRRAQIIHQKHHNIRRPLHRSAAHAHHDTTANKPTSVNHNSRLHTRDPAPFNITSNRR